MAMNIKELEIRVRVADTPDSPPETSARGRGCGHEELDGEVEKTVRRVLRRLRDPEER